MKLIGFTLISSIFLFLIGCTGCQKTRNVVDNDIRFDSIQTQETYHLFNDKSKPSCNLQINFTYPSDYSDKKILKTLQSIFVGKYFGDNFANKTPQEAIEAYKKEYIDSYKQFESENNAEGIAYDFDEEGPGSSFSYYESSKNTIVFNKGDILCCSVYFENYTGGAHGAHKLYGYSIDLSTGKLITERDIFCEGCLDKVASVIVRKIADKNNVSDPKELENIGYTDTEEMIPNGNFLINEEGITYIYNEYEIAPYVMGRTEVLLPYNEISIFLNPEGPVARLVQ